MFLLQAYLGVTEFSFEEGRVIDIKKGTLLAELDWHIRWKIIADNTTSFNTPRADWNRMDKDNIRLDLIPRFRAVP